MLRFTAFLSFPLMFGLTLVAHEFILVTIHEKWLDSVPLLQILCISGAFVPFYTLYQNLAISNGRSDIYLWCNISQIVLLIILILLFHRYGMIVMVAAYSTFTIAGLSVWPTFTRNIIGLRFWDALKDILPFMFAAAATMTATYFITRGIENLYLLLSVRVLIAGCL